MSKLYSQRRFGQTGGIVDECGDINMWLVTPKHGGRFGGSPMISGSSCMQLANSTSYILANHVVFVKVTQIVSEYL